IGIALIDVGIALHFGRGVALIDIGIHIRIDIDLIGIGIHIGVGADIGLCLIDRARLFRPGLAGGHILGGALVRCDRALLVGLVGILVAGHRLPIGRRA